MLNYCVNIYFLYTQVKKSEKKLKGFMHPYFLELENI